MLYLVFIRFRFRFFITSFARVDQREWLHTTTSVLAGTCCTHRHLMFGTKVVCSCQLWNKAKETVGAVRAAVTFDGVLYSRIVLTVTDSSRILN